MSSTNLLGFNGTVAKTFTPITTDQGEAAVVEVTKTHSIMTGEELANVTFLYSTIPVVDSSGNVGSWINLDPPLDGYASSIQLLRCSQSRVSQTAVVDAQSRQLITLTPSIVKTISTWTSANTSALDNNNNPAETLQTPHISLVDAVCTLRSTWECLLN